MTRGPVRSSIACGAAALWLALTSVSLPGAIAQGKPDGSNDDGLQKATRELAERLERHFDDAWDRPPVVARAPDLVLETAAEIRVARVLRGDRLEARGRAWSDVGLGDEGAPRRLLQALATGLKGVALDVEGRRVLLQESLYRMDEISMPQADVDFMLASGVHPDEPLLAHALINLRQVERQSGDYLRDTTDAMLAAAAWAEGEANLVAIRFLFDGMGLSDQVLRPLTSPGDFVEGRLLPRGLSRMPLPDAALLSFVYEDGFAVVLDCFRRGGWRGVADAMARPTTTQNVMHATAEARPPVDVPRVPLPIDGFVQVDVDQLGEQGVFALFARVTGKDSLALETAEGWSADALIRWEAGPEGLTQWTTVWRDETALSDFLYAWRRAWSERVPGGTWAKIGQDFSFSTGQRDVFVDVEGTTVTSWIGEPERMLSLIPYDDGSGDPADGD